MADVAVKKFKGEMMKGFWGSSVVALCGLCTSVLVALANVALARGTGWDPFTLMVWFVLPAGAALVGVAASSGYYIGARLFHKQARWPLLVQMLCIAAFTQFLIYWLDYVTREIVDGVRVASFVSFSDYLDLTLTSSHYTIGTRYNPNGADMGEVGSAGYWIAGLQFLGLMLGSLGIFLSLREAKTCTKCALYLKQLGNKWVDFRDHNEATQYYDAFFTTPLDSTEFGTRLRQVSQTAKAAKERGDLSISTTLYCCPGCKEQSLTQVVRQFNGKDWNAIDQLERTVAVPANLDLATLFKK